MSGIGFSCWHMMHHAFAGEFSFAFRFAVEFSAHTCALTVGTCLICWLACQSFEKWYNAVLAALALFVVLFLVGVPVIYFTLPESVK